MAPNEPTVEFSVKDLFLDIKNKLEEIKQTVDKKADRRELEALEVEVRKLQQDAVAKAAVEDVQSLAKATRLQWVGLIITSLIAMGGIVLDLLQHR